MSKELRAKLKRKGWWAHVLVTFTDARFEKRKGHMKFQRWEGEKMRDSVCRPDFRFRSSLLNFIYAYC